MFYLTCLVSLFVKWGQLCQSCKTTGQVKSALSAIKFIENITSPKSGTNSPSTGNSHVVFLNVYKYYLPVLIHWSIVQCLCKKMILPKAQLFQQLSFSFASRTIYGRSSSMGRSLAISTWTFHSWIRGGDFSLKSNVNTKGWREGRAAIPCTETTQTWHHAPVGRRQPQSRA